MKIPSNRRYSARLFLSVIVTWLVIDTAVAAPATATPTTKEDDWVAFGRDPGGSQYSPLAQIDANNVRNLRRAWTHRSGDFIDAPSPKGSILQATPVHVNGTLYFCTPFNRVFALDAETGRERWVFDPHSPDPQTGREALSPPRTTASRCRGVAYWDSALTADSLTADLKKSAAETPCRRRIFKNGENARVYALDADTGALCADFGSAKGHPGWASHADYENHGEGVMASSTSPPAVLGDIVIAAMAVNDGIANAKDGIVRAFDVRSGELRWEFNPIPPEFRSRSGAANVWSTISVDVANNLVFLPTTSPSTDYYGGGRRFEMPLANAIVALDGATGKVVWSRQVVRHDLFDYDLVSHPLLVDIRRDGLIVQAALLQTKMGWLYGFDRLTGEPLWPIVDREVPASDVPGEAAAATQPVPQGMAPFARQTLQRKDLFGITPLDTYACRRRFDELRYEGMYTPPSVRGSILFPSALGGGNWGGAAYDPATNSLILKAENLATVLRVIPKKDSAEDQQPPKDYLTRPLVGTPYRIEGELFNSPLGVPCTPPPWGTLMALDLGTGQARWKIPLGQIRRAGVTVPKGAGWGSPNVAGPMTTAGGLVFIGATMDSKLRALDTRTGKELWSADLPVPGMAVPMTYSVDGKQYVVIAAGGNAQVGTPIGDYLIAYALPD
ncbi:MAG: pyrroloquinoline quinone-dependent dehydrogenase [Gammaproteobacteria bacterium]|nr:pyrroloquinoline quinone-dependent dehydrogenase [Gammaproteobacteria bacterium]